jgi:hypothetical protein
VVISVRIRHVLRHVLQLLNAHRGSNVSVALVRHRVRPIINVQVEDVWTEYALKAAIVIPSVQVVIGVSMVPVLQHVPIPTSVRIMNNV